MNVLVKENVEAIKALAEGFRFASKTEVVVGIPESANAAHGDGVTNAGLMYIHENGSPVNHIPPRPVLKMGASDPARLPVIQQKMAEGLKLALQGNPDAATRAYQQAGMEGVNAVKEQFGSATLSPNNPGTVKRKGSSAPLIDTGALRSAITYAVRKKR